jgi:hypothetical protein
MCFFFGSVVLNSDCYGLMIKSVCAGRDGLDSNRSFQLPAANNAWAIVCAHVRGPSEGQSFAGSLHTNTRVRTHGSNHENCDCCIVVLLSEPTQSRMALGARQALIVPRVRALSVA